MNMSKNANKFSLARRMECIAESATLKLNATVQAMQQQGLDVVNFTAGEPDFWVPEPAKEAAVEAIKKNQSRYTPVPGILDLRKAIAEKTNKQHAELSKSHPWTPQDIVVSNGGKQALFNALMAILDPGDEVLIPSPYWLSYPEMVKIVGGIPKFISGALENNFKIKPEQLKSAISPKVKVLIINSPCNPTGVMYSKAELKELGEVIRTTSEAENLRVISDEIYDRIVFSPNAFCSFLNAAPELRDRTITINAMSKSAAMTGWRIGWSVAPQLYTSAMSTLQGQMTSGINSVAQWASLAALKLPEEYFAQQVFSFQKRRDLLLENLKKLSKIEVVVPDGAFYLFIGVKSLLKAGEDSIAFSQRLLEEARVAVVPGTPFGEPEYIRISFATDEAILRKGCDRLIEYLSR